MQSCWWRQLTCRKRILMACGKPYLAKYRSHHTPYQPNKPYNSSLVRLARMTLSPKSGSHYGDDCYKTFHRLHHRLGKVMATARPSERYFQWFRSRPIEA